MRDREEFERGERAKRIMEDDLVQAAFAYMEDDIMNQWKESGPDDSEARERAYRMHRTLHEFKSYFKRAIATGDQARRNLEKRNG